MSPIREVTFCAAIISRRKAFPFDFCPGLSPTLFKEVGAGS